MSKSKVSVCIPVYNAVPYIKEAVDSVLSQTYKEFELVIVDNYSTDGTYEILKTYTDPRIRLYRNEKTILSPQNWNRCLELAQGDYVALYHADDYYYPDIVREEACILDKYPEVGAVFTFADYLTNTKDPKLLPIIPDIFQEINLYDFKKTINLIMRHACVFFCPTAMFRKSVIDEVGEFDYKNITYTFDLDMWLRISQISKLCIINKRLMRYRIAASKGSLEFAASGHREHYMTVDKYLKLGNIFDWFNWNYLIYLKAKIGIRRRIKNIINAAKG